MKLFKRMLIDDQDERANSKQLVEIINIYENSIHYEELIYKDLCPNYLGISSRFIQGFDSEFIGRTQVIKNIENILTKKQGVILTAFGGCGKSRLANEIGIKLKSDYIVRLLNCETIDKLSEDYNQLFELIYNIPNHNFNKYSFDNIIEKIQLKIKNSDSKLLFILDNVENYEDIEKVIKNLPENKVKIIITTRNDIIIQFNHYIENKFEIIKVDLFNKEDARDYLEKNLKRKDKVIIDEIIKSKMINNEILPLDLYLTVNYINLNLASNINILFKNIKERSDSIAKYLFSNLQKNSKESFELLCYCAYLDPDSITFNLLNHISNTNDSSDFFNEMSKHGLVNIIDIGVKMHRSIQEELKFFINNNQKILIENLVDIFITKIGEIDNCTFFLTDQDHSNFNQIDKILNEINKSQLQIDHKKLLKLKIKYSKYLLYKSSYDKSKNMFLEVFKSLQKEINDNDNLILINETLHGLGKVYLEMDNLLKAIEFFQKSYEIIKNLSNENQIKLEYLSQYYFYFGEMCNKINKLEKGFEYHFKSYEIKKEKFKDKIEIVDSLNALAFYHESKKDWNKALEYRTEANKILEIKCGEKKINIKEHPKLAETLENLGILKGKLWKLNDEKEFYLKAHNMKLKLFKKKQNNEHMAKSFELMANVNRKNGEKSLEIENRKICVNIKNNIYEDYKLEHKESLELLAKCYEEENNFKEAQKIYKDILKLIEKKNKIDYEEIIKIKYDIAICYMVLNEKEKCKVELIEIYDLKEKINLDNIYFDLSMKMLYSLITKRRKVEKKIKEEIEKNLLKYFKKDKYDYNLRNKLIVSGAGIQDNTIKIWNLETGECLKTLEGHSNSVNSLILLPNNLLASGSFDKTIKIWNIETGECLKTLEGSDHIYNLKLLEHNFLASLSISNYIINIWNIETCKCLELFTHSVSVNNLIFLPNNKLATVSSDKTIKIWNIESCECLKTFRIQSSSVNVLPNNRLAIGLDNGSIIICNIETLKCITILKGHSKPINSLVFIPNNQLATGSYDETIKVWNIQSGECLKSFKEHSSWVKSLVLLENNLLASVFLNSISKIWNIETGKCLELDHHSVSVNSLVLLANNILATSSFDEAIKIWNLETSECLKTLKGHSERVLSLILLPNNYLASGSNDQTIKIWNIQSGECLKTLKGHFSYVISLILLKSNSLSIGSSDKALKILNIEKGECLKTIKAHSSSVNNLVLLPNNKIATVSSDKKIKIWNIETDTNNKEANECFKILNGHSDYIYSLILLENKLLASGSWDKTIKIWNIQSGECLKTLELHESKENQLVLLPNSVNSILSLPNNLLASGSFDKTIKIWNIENDTNKCSKKLQGHSSWVTSLVLLSNNKLASGSVDKTIKIWNIETCECLKTLEGHSSSVNILVLLSNKLLATASSDKTIKIWNIETDTDKETEKCLRTLEGHSDYIYSLILLENNFLASLPLYDKSIKIWNIATGECLKTLEGHSGAVKSLVLLQNNLLATASLDETIKIWNLENGECLKTIKAHSKPINSLMLFANNKLVSGSDDKTIKIWNVDLFLFFYSLKVVNFFICSNYILDSFSFEFLIFSFLKHNDYFIFGCSDFSIKFYSKYHFDMIFQLTGHNDFVRCLTMYNSNLLLSGSDDQTIRIWNLNTKKCIKVINAHNGAVKSILVLQNNNIVSCSDDKSIKIWKFFLNESEVISSSQISKRKKFDELLIDKQNAHSDEINCLINLPKYRFASGSVDKKIKIWNSSNLDLLYSINSISNSIYSLLYIPKGYIIAGSFKDIYVIDVKNDQKLESNESIFKILKGHSREVTSLCLDEEKSNLISASLDSTVITWII